MRPQPGNALQERRDASEKREGKLETDRAAQISVLLLLLFFSATHSGPWDWEKGGKAGNGPCVSD